MAPELLSAGQEERGAFCEVALERAGVISRFRFGVSTEGLAVLQRVLSTRPFDAMPGLPYRYFYAGQSGRLGEPVQHTLHVRVELGQEGRTLTFNAPREIVGTLNWFRELPDVTAAEHLLAPT